jgi:hypothetical protein
MARRTTDRTREALDLYELIRPCFATQADRAQAIGISRTAIRPWDRSEIKSVNESSLQRIRLVAKACTELQATMPAHAVGSYLLGSCMVDRVMPRLNLIISTGTPEIVTDLARAESDAFAKVVVKHLPPEAFEDAAWADILAELPDGNRKLAEVLKRRSKGRIVASI